MNFNIEKSIKSAVQNAVLVLKLIVPLFILAEILLYLDVLQYIAFIFEPITDILNLPKEASIGIAAAIFFNIYAGLAFLAPLQLSSYEWTILGIFLGIAHSLVVENAMMKKIGIPNWYSWILRISIAYVAILPLQLFTQRFFEKITPTIETMSRVEYVNFHDMLWHAVENAMILSIKVILIVTVIIFVMDYVKSRKFMLKYKKKADILFAIGTGLLLGITYGAGIIISEVQKGTLTKADILYIGTFLMICHSVIEDILLFVIFGANGWIILAIRVIMALLFSYLFVQFYKRKLDENHTI